MATSFATAQTQARTLNACVIRSTLVAAVGGLLFGFDTAVISGTTSALTAVFGLSPASLGWTVASAVWGTVLGSMVACWPGDRFGRRDSLRGLAILYVLSALGCAFAWNWSTLVVFRVIEGLAIGGSSVLGPMYIAEIAPAKWRGRLVAFFQFSIVLGILLAYVSNWAIRMFSLGATEWRWMLGISALPAAIFLPLLYSIPRSPRWLVKQRRIDEARNALERLGEPDVEEELRVIAATVASSESSSQKLFSWEHRKPIMLAVLVALFNQVSGINAILYYANYIFERAGFSGLSGDWQSMAIGATNLTATFLAMTVIDRIGRRTLLLFGSLAMVVCQGACAVLLYIGKYEQFLVIPLAAFIACFAVSSGAVIWVYISEVFPNSVRAKGQSLGSFTHWITCAGLSLVFPMLASTSPWNQIAFIAFMMLVQFVVVSRFFPETKGKTLEELQDELGAVPSTVA